MKKSLTLTLLGLIITVASYAQLLPISGVLGCCVGGHSSLIDSSGSSLGTWSSSNVAVATVDGFGFVYGVTPGTTTITYGSGGSIVTAPFTVSNTPASITGPTTLCAGGSITLSDATPGGTWSSWGGPLSVNSVGVVTGAYTGSSLITYTIGVGCSVTRMDTVTSGASTGGITGDSMVCAGSTTTLADAVGGGVWSSSNTAVATVDAASGVVGGVASGAATISYTVTGTCGATSATFGIFITTPGTAGTISGVSSLVVAGSYDSYSGSVCCGTWSSSNTGVATINPSSGLLYGVGAGTTTLTYSVTSCGTTTTSTFVVTVTAVNRISGNINFAGAALDSTSTIKVWLITYNPATHLLAAVDSQTLSAYGSSVHYQFLGEPTDSYRVKAAVNPTLFSTTGYMPTYHTSSSYWASANVFHHAGGMDDGENINMAYGTVTSGPGFVGGDVTTGANKGTTDGAPAVGLQIYALSSTGALLQYTFTDAAGHYSFGNLPVGTYTIYPEAINYATTAYTSINITSGAPSMSAANFVQHTISHTITPVTTGVNSVKSYVSTVTASPNPTSGKLNVQWQESAAETGNVTIADITGKEIYKTTINMNEGAGLSQLDLSSLTNGIYMITIKSGTINYNNKIQVQH